MGFTALGNAWAELAQGDSLSVVWATSASVNKGRVVPVHVEMLVVNEETLTHSRVSVIQSVDIEPMIAKAKWLGRTFIPLSLTTYSSSSGRTLHWLLATICLVSVKMQARAQSFSAASNSVKLEFPASTITCYL